MTVSTQREHTITFRAMATDVTVQVLGHDAEAAHALERARDVFTRVEAACTRFDPASPLMQANASPDRWHDVPWECAAAIDEASMAHAETDGVFDPRILDDLVALGYDRSLPFADGSGTVRLTGPSAEPAEREARARWTPRVRAKGGRWQVHLGGARVDLGGIGKGLAVRWAADELRRVSDNAMVEAGGDCQLVGPGPEGAGWRVGMEDPSGRSDPLVVFELTDLACATSSVRVRRWTVGDRQVHHLIDPRTGASGGDGLVAVTVLDPDPAWAEVWSKTLFLSGAARIGAAAECRGLAAVWVEADGRVTTTAPADALVLWRASHV